MTPVGDTTAISDAWRAEWAKEGRPTGMAAMRDASWFPSPGRASRYHIHVYRLAMMGDCAACGIPITCDDHAVPLADVPDSLRCRKKGCADKWP